MTTERMTDKRREELRGYLERQYVKPHEAKEVNAELDRARRREQGQAETIRNLVNVLESELGLHHANHSMDGPAAFCTKGRCGVINKVLAKVAP